MLSTLSPSVATLSILFGGNGSFPSIPQVNPGSPGCSSVQASTRRLSWTRVSSCGSTGLKSPATRPRPALRRRDETIDICWGRREGCIGRESRCTLTSRIRAGLVLGRPGDGTNTSQQSASLPNRVGYFTLQTLPGVALPGMSPGRPNRSLDRRVTVVKDWPPRLVASASLDIQCC